MGSKVMIIALIVAVVLIAVGYAMFAAIKPEIPSNGGTTPPAPLTCTPSLKCEGNSKYEVRADCSQGDRIPCGASETCVNGACVPSTPPTSESTNKTKTCTDSDSVSYYVPGEVTTCTGMDCVIKADSCDGKVVTEYLCSVEKTARAINITCPYSCVDGACTKTA